MPDTTESKPIRQKAKSSFAAFVAEDAIDAVRKTAGEIGATAPQIIRGTVVDAIRRLSDVPTPKQLLVDLSGSADPLAAIDSLAEVCDEGTQVIALGDINDVELYRSLIGHGVHDYLVKPVSAEALTAVLAPSVGRMASRRRRWAG
jgi:pilus assembly protein CpaE